MNHLLALFVLVTLTGGHAVLSSDDTPIYIKDLALPRYFGTAANTSWLYVDQNYTNIAKTQVLVSSIYVKLSHCWKHQSVLDIYPREWKYVHPPLISIATNT